MSKLSEQDIELKRIIVEKMTPDEIDDVLENAAFDRWNIIGSGIQKLNNTFRYVNNRSNDHKMTLLRALVQKRPDLRIIVAITYGLDIDCFKTVV
jgi:hypothetical protein